MCTPEKMPELCSCPHLALRDLRNILAAAAAVAVSIGLWLVVSTGWAWTLLLPPWGAAMYMSARVSSARARSRAASMIVPAPGVVPGRGAARAGAGGVSRSRGQVLSSSPAGGRVVAGQGGLRS
jgi:hypothetical protein